MQRNAEPKNTSWNTHQNEPGTPGGTGKTQPLHESEKLGHDGPRVTMAQAEDWWPNPGPQTAMPPGSPGFSP